MNNRKNHNSILFLTTLGVYLGLVFVGANQNLFAQSEPAINRKPLKDLAHTVQRQAQSREVDLNAPFLIELSGTIGKNGKLDPTTANYVRAEGDAKIIEVAKRAVEAVNDAGYFAYLSVQPANPITIFLSQDGSQFVATITSALTSEARAKSMASVMNIMLSMVRKMKEDSPESEQNKTDLIILNSAQVSSEAKNFLISFRLPKNVFHELLDRELGKLSRSATE